MLNATMKSFLAKSLVVGLGAVFLTLAASEPLRAQSLNPANRHADPAALKAGLAVCYIGEFVRHIDQMIEWEGYRTCKEGPPIEKLDYRVGQGNVLTSESDNGVMAKITGYIHLDKPGFYAFGFESNDGVRLEIDGSQILEDPDVHADRFSDIGGLEVKEPGWYPILIRYFERKNTSTLRFFWQPPGSDGTMPLVPAEALAHGS